MKKTLRSNAIAAGGEQIVVGVSYFIFYGVLIRMVGADVVGVFSLVLVLASLVSMTSAGFASALAHFVPLFEGQQDRRSTIQCLDTTLLCTAILYAGVLCIAYFPFEAAIALQAGRAHAKLVSELMVPATFHVFLLGVGAATTLALTALHRNDLRLWAALAGAAIGLTVLSAGVPRFGAVAGLWAMAAQSGTVAVITWLQLYRILPELGLIPRRFDRSMAKQLFRLGSNMQVQSLLVAGVEPVTRLLIGHFGSLGAVAYFSMANRFVLQMRSLIYAAAQPLLSAFSHVRATRPEEIGSLYSRAEGTVGFTAIAALSATAGAAPFVGEVWIGEKQSDFVIFTVILSLGWLINTVALTAYFNAYSLGKMTYSLIGHVMMFAINLLLGVPLGALLGTNGAVAGMSAALLISSVFMGIANGRYAPPHGSSPILRAHILLAICGALAAAAALVTYDWLRLSAPPILSGIGCGLVWLVILGPVSLMHPAAKVLLVSFRTSRPAPR